MSNSRPVATLLPPGPPPTLTMGELLLDPSEYRATVEVFNNCHLPDWIYLLL